MKQILITFAAVLVVGCNPNMGIHQAAYNGNAEVVNQLIATGTDINSKDTQGLTPLHLASMAGQSEIADLLIANGANVNGTDDGGLTPLIMAVLKSQKEMLEQLLNNGANLNLKTNQGFTALDWAIHFKLTEITKLIRENGGKSGTEDSIHVAVVMGKIEAIQKHLSDGVDINSIDVKGLTPLHLSATFGYKEVTAFLIQAGADVNRKDENGNTSLDWAETVIELRSFSDNIKSDKQQTSDLLRKHGGKTSEELKAAEN